MLYKGLKKIMSLDSDGKIVENVIEKEILKVSNPTTVIVKNTLARTRQSAIDTK
jgi:hypothetical protein